MTIAVYAGSFDPITAGHLSVIRQAVRLFAHVRVLIAVNPEKKGMFDQDERLYMARDALGRIPNVSVDCTNGLVVEYAADIAASVLLRGIRGSSDAESETELAQINRTIAPQISTILLPADPKLACVSSSGLKQMAQTGEDVSPFCTPLVAELLSNKLAKAVST